MANLLLLNGPNLNLLGQRETAIYGTASLAALQQRLDTIATTKSHQLMHFQSNAEHELINRIHQAQAEKVDFIIINPAAYTHTSIALRDALLAVDIPFIEVHLSNIHRRESFRHHSYLADIAVGTITGLGNDGYEFALLAADNYLRQSNQTQELSKR